MMSASAQEATSLNFTGTGVLKKIGSDMLLSLLPANKNGRRSRRRPFLSHLTAV
jgi:hypothetical protein